MYYAAIALTIVANVAYHVFQKSIRADASPAASLVITYAVALVCSLVMLVASSGARPIGNALSQTGWASYGLGLAIVGLELGFLWAYRAGWDLALAAPYANVAVAVVLLPLGILAFGDSLTPRKFAGIALAVAAILLMAGRPQASKSVGDPASPSPSSSPSSP